jgi:hypothetical protein
LLPEQFICELAKQFQLLIVFLPYGNK